MAGSVNGADIQKLKLLFTVVDKEKGEFYLDVLSQFDVNFQMSVPGKGTATSEFVDLLGLNMHKVVLFSVVREDQVDSVMNCLEDRFKTIKNGQGISFAVPLSSIIGVNLYRFMSNNR